MFVKNLFQDLNINLIVGSTGATLFMVFISAIVAVFFGTMIALGLYLTAPYKMCENNFIHKILGFIVTIGRCVPFIILMIALIPFTRFLIGTSIGTTAAIVPLSIAAIPFFARIFEGKLLQLPAGIFLAADSMGFTPLQTIFRVIFPEVFPAFINCVTILLVTLTEYSTMAGTVGGSGLGNTALQYGFYQFNTKIMIQAILVLILLILFIQYLGDKFSEKFSYQT